MSIASMQKVMQKYICIASIKKRMQKYICILSMLKRKKKKKKKKKKKIKRKRKRKSVCVYTGHTLSFFSFIFLQYGHSAINSTKHSSDLRDIAMTDL